MSKNNDTIYLDQYRKSKAIVTHRGSVGAMILAAFLILIEAAVLFSKPAISLSGNVYYVGQGVAAFAILVGALFWGVAEMFTPSGKGFWSLAGRFTISFIFGAILGGIVGSVSHFGRLVLIPAYDGNGLAIFMALGYLFLFGSIVATAAWMHSRTFRASGVK